MNCQAIQNRILALPDPRQVPDPLRAHLDGCPTCEAWWKQAVRLERLLERLPAPPPPAGKKAALIDDLTAAGPVIRSIPRLSDPAPTPGVAFLRRNAKALAGLAAGVLVILGGWWAVRPGKTEVVLREAPKHPLLEKLVQRDVALSRAKTPAERLALLGGLADDLSGETRGLARVATAEELRDLSQWFDKVVRDGIVKQADGVAGQPTVPAGEKVALLTGIADKLDETRREVERVAAEAPPHSQPALKRMAETAKDGQTKLRALARTAGA